MRACAVCERVRASVCCVRACAVCERVLCASVCCVRACAVCACCSSSTQYRVLHDACEVVRSQISGRDAPPTL